MFLGTVRLESHEKMLFETVTFRETRDPCAKQRQLSKREIKACRSILKESLISPHVSLDLNRAIRSKWRTSPYHASVGSLVVCAG